MLSRRLVKLNLQEKEENEDGEVSSSTGSFLQENLNVDSKPTVSEQININDSENNAQNGIQVIYFVKRLYLLVFP